ncbi:uncharacterized protein LOC134247050 [Saccostrea cucullata]|uniref:uncharacterized protein LOC134247050 n=1 Tax=Saccostrea cuccullata TaxID=36930 RepID=UPI002ED07A59
MEETFDVFVFDEEESFLELDDTDKPKGVSGQSPQGAETSDWAEMVSITLRDSEEEDASQATAPPRDAAEARPEDMEKRPRGVRKCAVDRCGEVFTGATPMQYHIWRDHAKEAREPIDFINVLVELSAQILGPTEDKRALVSLGRLRTWIQSQLGRVSWGFSWPVREAAVGVSTYLGIVPPSSRQISDVSKGKVTHVALLVHPRLMALAINEATRRGHWRGEWERSRSDLDKSKSDIAESWEDELVQPEPVQVDSEVTHARAEVPAVSQGPSKSTTSPREDSDQTVVVVDCHWHPGRLPDPFTGDLDVFTTLDKRPVEVPVTLTGGCVIYGLDEPHDVPKRILRKQWVIARGIHPKEASRANSDDVRVIVELCRSNTWATGEIGLDYTIGGHRQQKFILAEFFRRADVSTNMVLHLRGAEDDPLGLVPTQDCITLLDGLGVPTLAPIYLHCFTGGPDQVCLWFRTGRPVYFGVSGKVFRMSPLQQAGVRAIPDHKLLVETDSPYMPCSVPFPMTPKHIGTIYRRVAELRRKPLSLLANEVHENFKSFFGVQLKKQ